MNGQRFFSELETVKDRFSPVAGKTQQQVVCLVRYQLCRFPGLDGDGKAGWASGGNCPLHGLPKRKWRTRGIRSVSKRFSRGLPILEDILLRARCVRSGCHDRKLVQPAEEQAGDHHGEIHGFPVRSFKPRQRGAIRTENMVVPESRREVKSRPGSRRDQALVPSASPRITSSRQRIKNVTRSMATSLPAAPFSGPLTRPIRPNRSSRRVPRWYQKNRREVESPPGPRSTLGASSQCLLPG